MDLIPQQTLLPASGVQRGSSIPVYVDFAALVAANPSPVIGDKGIILGGGYVEFTASGWLGNIGLVAYASLPAANIANGSTATCPQLLGDDVFSVRRHGGRWEVLIGQSPISASGTNGTGYQLIAAGTSLVVMSSVPLPAGIVGLSEGWDVWVDGKNDGVYVSGSDAFSVRFQSGSIGLTSTAVANNNSRVARGVGVFYRRPSNVLQRSLSGISYSGVASSDVTLDLSVSQVLEATITPGASTNTSTIRSWGVSRIA